MRRCWLLVLLLGLCSVSLGAQSSMVSELGQLAGLWQTYDRISTELLQLLELQGTDLGTLVNRVETLTNELEALKAELEQWRLEVQELQGLSETLVTASKLLETDIKTLNHQLLEFSQRYSELERQVSDLQASQHTFAWVAGITVAVTIVGFIVYSVMTDRRSE